MRNVGTFNSAVKSNLNRVYLLSSLIVAQAVYFLARASILGPERW